VGIHPIRAVLDRRGFVHDIVRARSEQLQIDSVVDDQGSSHSCIGRQIITRAAQASSTLAKRHILPPLFLTLNSTPRPSPRDSASRFASTQLASVIVARAKPHPRDMEKLPVVVNPARLPSRKSCSPSCYELSSIKTRSHSQAEPD